MEAFGSGTAPLAPQQSWPVPPNIDLEAASLKVEYTATLIVMLVLPSIAVLIRLYTRIWMMKVFRFADLACILGYLLLIATIGLGFHVMVHGMGRTVDHMDGKTFHLLRKTPYINQVLYGPDILFTKLAILFQLLEIFVPSRATARGRWYCLVTLIIINVLFYTAQMMLKIFQCTPREKIWNPTTPGECLSMERSFFATGVFNVVDDFIMLIIPLVWTWQLRLKPGQKVGVSLIFGTGFIACVISMVRLVTSALALKNNNLAHSLITLSLLAPAEVAAGLMICCLPTLPRFFKRKRRQVTFSSSSPARWDFTSHGRSMTQVTVDDNIELSQSAASFSLDPSNGGYILKTVCVEQSTSRLSPPPPPTQDTNDSIRKSHASSQHSSIQWVNKVRKWDN